MYRSLRHLLVASNEFMIPHSLSLETKGKAGYETDLKLVCCKLKMSFYKQITCQPRSWASGHVWFVEQSAVMSWWCRGLCVCRQGWRCESWVWVWGGAAVTTLPLSQRTLDQAHTHCRDSQWNPFSPGGQGGLVTTKLSPFSCPLPAGRWGHRSLLPGTVQLSYPAEVRNIIETADSDMYLLTADFSWECIQTAWHFCSLLSGA